MSDSEGESLGSTINGSDYDEEDSVIEEEEEQGYPPILEGVIAFLDVRVDGKSSYSASLLSAKLEEMGAKVLPKWSRSATHVVWKDGKNLKALQTAFNKGDPIAVIVSPLWVELCYETKQHRDESDFMVPIDASVFLKAKKRKSFGNPAEKLHKKSSALVEKENNDSSVKKTKKKKSVQKENVERDDGEDELVKKKTSVQEERIEETALMENHDEIPLQDKPQNISKEFGEKDTDAVAKGKKKKIISKHSIPKPVKRSKPIIKKKKTTTVSVSEETSVSVPSGKREVVQESFVVGASSCPDEVRDILNGAAANIPDSEFSDDEMSPFTHLVIGERNRTMKALFCIARGAWMLSPSWAYAALESGEWPKESEYLNELFPGAKKSRLIRQTGDINELLFDGMSFCISPQKKSPSKKMISKLVQLCGGKIVNTAANADVYIASETLGPSLAKSSSHKCIVKPQWLYTCVAEYELQDYETFLFPTEQFVDECPSSPGI